MNLLTCLLKPVSDEICIPRDMTIVQGEEALDIGISQLFAQSLPTYKRRVADNHIHRWPCWLYWLPLLIDVENRITTLNGIQGLKNRLLRGRQTISTQPLK